MSEVHSPALFSEDDILPISALADLAFCERRAALHHIEGIWQENIFTAEGSVLHERTHDAGTEARADIRITRSLRLRSLTLGLSGMADVVEFHRLKEGQNQPGIALEGVDGLWFPKLVEYKRGRLRKEQGYEIQLCAQAVCLEEMLSIHMLKGEIFYGKTRRRLEIAFDDELRKQTQAAAVHLHELISSCNTPKAIRTPRCQRCSLLGLCLPAVTGARHTVKGYLRRAIKEAEDKTV